MKYLAIILISGLVSNPAFAAGGSFYCETNPGTGLFDGIYVSGQLDGEAQVTDLVVNYATGDGLEVPLRLRSIGLDDEFALVAIEPLEDDSTVITIAAPKINGRSVATFEIRNGEAVEYRTGTCDVSFKPGQ